MAAGDDLFGNFVHAGRERPTDVVGQVDHGLAHLVLGQLPAIQRRLELDLHQLGLAQRRQHPDGHQPSVADVELGPRPHLTEEVVDGEGHVGTGDLVRIDGEPVHLLHLGDAPGPGRRCGGSALRPTVGRSSGSGFTHGWPPFRSCRLGDRLGLEILLKTGDTRLAPDAGLFIAAEGHVGAEPQSAVDPDGACPDPVGHADGAVAIRRPYRPRQSVGGVVGQGHRMVVAVMGNHHEDGSEDLLSGHACAVVDTDDERRLDEETAIEPVRAASSGDDRPALLAGQADVPLHPVALPGADQRPADGAGVGGVTRGQLAQDLRRRVHRLVEEPSGHDQPGGDGTTLAGVRADGECGGGARPPQVGVVQDHECRFASELEEDLLQGVGGGSHHPPSGGGGAGEAHLVHTRVAGQQGPDGVIRRGDDVDHAGGAVGLLGDQPAEHGGAPRCVRRRLEHDGVAGSEGRSQLGQVDLVWDVPRGDGTDHPGRLAPNPAVGGDAERCGVPEVRLPLVALGQVGHPPQRLDRRVQLCRVGERQGRPGLRHGHGPQLVGVCRQRLLQLAEAGHPPFDVGRPVGVVASPTCGGDGLFQVLGSAIGNHPEDLLGGRVDGLERPARARRSQFAVDQQALLAHHGISRGAHGLTLPEPVPTPKMSSQCSSVMTASGSSTSRVRANSRAARRSLWASDAADCIAPTRPRSSSSPNGATVERNIKVDVPPMRTSLALTTWASFPRSMPAASANSWPSYAASHDPYCTRLRASFAASPVPNAPMVTVNEPKASKTGRTRSITSGSPPTMQTSSPSAAALGPPLTPQSTTGAPTPADSAPMASTQAAEMVLTTMKVVSGPAAANPPPGPDSTAWTWASSTTATTTTSARRPIWSGERATSARSRYLSVASGLTSQTTSGNPSRNTLEATPSPIAPSPITPTTGAAAPSDAPVGCCFGTRSPPVERSTLSADDGTCRGGTPTAGAPFGPADRCRGRVGLPDRRASHLDSCPYYSLDI